MAIDAAALVIAIAALVVASIALAVTVVANWPTPPTHEDGCTAEHSPGDNPACTRGPAGLRAVRKDRS